MNFCRNCGAALKSAPSKTPAPPPAPALTPQASKPLPPGARMPSAAEVVKGRAASAPAVRDGKQIAQASTDPATTSPGTMAPPPKTVPPGVRPPGVPHVASRSQSAPPMPDAVAETLAADATAASQLLRQARARPPTPDPANRRTIEEDAAIVKTLPETPVHQLSQGAGGVVRTPAPGFGGAARSTPPGAGPVMSSALPMVAVPAPAGTWGRLVSVRQDGSDGPAFTLDDATVHVGRETEPGFPDDRFLAPLHARFEHEGGTTRLTPLDTVNGVYRRLTEPVTLQQSDWILVGRQLLRFEAIDAEERTASPMVQHGVVRFGSPAREPWGRLLQIMPSGAVRDVRTLEGTAVILGREEGDLVFAHDEFLSRRHAALKWRDGQCVLEDLRSSNGTYLRLRGPASLGRVEYLRIGNQLFRFEATA
jgi:pSer/pThr/pTyr-binding forkhead associated (FHA) protein